MNTCTVCGACTLWWCGGCDALGFANPLCASKDKHTKLGYHIDICQACHGANIWDHVERLAYLTEDSDGVARRNGRPLPPGCFLAVRLPQSIFKPGLWERRLRADAKKAKFTRRDTCQNSHVITPTAIWGLDGAPNIDHMLELYPPRRAGNPSSRAYRQPREIFQQQEKEELAR